MIAPAPARTGDAVAISLSGLCLIHCLALPVLTGFLPLMGAWAEAEWVHLGFVGLAVPVSIWTLSRPPRAALPKPHQSRPGRPGQRFISATGYVVPWRPTSMPPGRKRPTLLIVARIH